MSPTPGASGLTVPMPRRTNGHGPTMATGPVATVETPEPETVVRQHRRGDPLRLHALVTAIVVIGLAALALALALSGVIPASESTLAPVMCGVIALANVLGWSAGAMLRRGWL